MNTAMTYLCRHPHFCDTINKPPTPSRGMTRFQDGRPGQWSALMAWLCYWCYCRSSGSFRAKCFWWCFFDWCRKRASTGRALAQLNLWLFHLQRTSWWWCRPPKQSFKPMQDPLQESSSRVILWTSDEWSGKKQSGHRIDILEECGRVTLYFHGCMLNFVRLFTISISLWKWWNTLKWWTSSCWWRKSFIQWGHSCILRNGSFGLWTNRFHVGFSSSSCHWPPMLWQVMHKHEPVTDVLQWIKL